MIMKKIISILFAASILLASCDNDNEAYYYDMYLAIEVVDNQGNNLLGNSSVLINQGETKIRIAGEYCYLNSQIFDRYTFRNIQDATNSYIKIGCWYSDRTDTKITIDWSNGIEKDVIIFSYDSPLNGLESPSHDFRYPYSITINGKELELNEENGHFIYVKDINP